MSLKQVRVFCVSLLVASTLATGFKEVCSPNRKQTNSHVVLNVGLHQTPIHHSLVPLRFHPNPAIPDFWSSLLVSEHLLILVSSSLQFCPSHIDLLQLLVGEEELGTE